MAEQEPGNAHLLAIEDFEPAEFAMDDLFEMEEEEEEEPLDPDEIAARQAALEILLAVQEGDTVEVTRLLDAKPHLLETAKHNMHRTLLMAAAVGGHLDVMKALLGRGADISCTEAMGRTALDLATEEGQTEAMMLLLRSGAEIAGPRRGWGGHRNALTWAASGGHLDCTRLLLEHMRGRGVNIPHTNLYGHTALHQAISRGHVDIARVLLLAGADHTITGSDGMASRRLAYCCSQRQCVPLLEWWEGELECAYALYRARRLDEDTTSLEQPPGVPVPAYLRVRAENESPYPHVQVIASQHNGQQEGPGAKRQGHREDEDEERDAMIKYVLHDLAPELHVELMAGFHYAANHYPEELHSGEEADFED